MKTVAQQMNEKLKERIQELKEEIDEYKDDAKYFEEEIKELSSTIEELNNEISRLENIEAAPVFDLLNDQRKYDLFMSYFNKITLSEVELLTKYK